MRRRTLTCAVVSLVVALLALSQAWGGRDPGEDYWIDLKDATSKTHSGTINWLASNWTVWAGAYWVEIRDYTGISTGNDPGNTPPKSTRETWVVCIDRVQLSDPDWYMRCVGGVPSSNTPALTREKWAKKVWLVNTFGYGAVWNGNKDTACGLQLAIWEVLTDDPDENNQYNLYGGSFQVVTDPQYTVFPQTARDYAAWLLGQVPAVPQDLPEPWKTWYNNDVYYVNSQNFNEVPIPEPFTLVLAGLGIGTVAGLRRLAMR